MSIVVSDTSPIRALAHLGDLDLLRTLFGEVLVPPAVVSELKTTFGPGEAEALVLAVEVHADAILIDESAGRAEALRRGLAPLGVLGILLRARQRGLVPALRPLLDRLQNELGFFISPELLLLVLNQASE